MSLEVATSAFGAPDADPIDWPDDWAAPPPDLSPAPNLFTRHSAAELLAMPDRFDWLAAGMLAKPTYGQAGGEPKTLKSTVNRIIGVGLAAGLPIFGQFAVPQAMPWLVYSAEGGRILFTRSTRRIADAYGVNAADLPIHASFDVAPIMSARFRGSLERDLKETQPGLTTIDPLYAYHGGAVKASSLHEEGELLTTLSSACLDAGSSLVVVNHFNKTGNGSDLQRFTMTGAAEWSDSWLLLNHRTDPDVQGGRFWLRLIIGSRQWGGGTWDLDLNIGRFDENRGAHDGDITWEIRRAGNTIGHEADHATEILQLLADKPWQLTRANVADEIGGNAKDTRTLIAILTQQGQIVTRPTLRDEKKRRVRRDLYALATEPRLDEQTELDGVATNA